MKPAYEAALLSPPPPFLQQCKLKCISISRAWHGCSWNVDEPFCRLLVNLSQELLAMTACHPCTSWNTKLVCVTRGWTFLQVVGKFIARAVADDCLPPKYIMKYKTEAECPLTKWVLLTEMHGLCLRELAFVSIPSICFSACQNHPCDLSESPLWITVWCFAAGEDYLSKKKEVLC